MEEKRKKMMQASLFSFLGKEQKTEEADSCVFSDPALIPRENKEEENMRRKTMAPVYESTPKKPDSGERYSWLEEVRDADGNPVGSEEYNSRTLFIPPQQWGRFSPFERQYWEVKSRNFDKVVFFKKGKFYEIYEGDADLGARLFDLKVTGRVNMRMAGFPVVSFEQWAERFIAKGYSVARVDQKENEIGKSIREKEQGRRDKVIERELTDVLTAGTVIDGGLVDKTRATYCTAVKFGEKGSCGVCFVDASKAEFHFSFFEDDERGTMLDTLLEQTRPKEILYERGLETGKRKRLAKTQGCKLISLCPYKEFLSCSQAIDDLERYEYLERREDVARLVGLFSGKELVGAAFGGIMFYLRTLCLDKKVIGSGVFSVYSPLEHGDTLLLDGQTLSNLCVLDSDGGGSLLGEINLCKTVSGKRKMREWVCRPLQSIEQIVSRQDAVKFFVLKHSVMSEVRRMFGEVDDIERAVGRAAMGVCSVRDFCGCIKSLKACGRIVEFLQEEEWFESELLSDLCAGFPLSTRDLEEMEDGFSVECSPEQKIVPREGAVPEYDRIEQEVGEIDRKLGVCLEDVRRKYKCKDISYKSIGKEEFQLEIPESILVSSDFFLLSKREGWRRYWTQELKVLGGRRRDLEEMRAGIVCGFFAGVQKMFSAKRETWNRAADAISELDCLCSFAVFSSFFGEDKCCPVFESTDAPFFMASQLFYPNGLINTERERESTFIPNDISIGEKERVFLLTGPNMGGKSTILRQTCLCIILGQLGSFVPARECRMGVFDRIFTRIGANDNILSGQSTFMVELTETARILREATPRSFVVVDELGRGTSTFDGLAIAHATLGYLADTVGCVGMFATHYKELAVDYRSEESIRPMHMECIADPETNEIVFLYKLVPGVAEKSYGTNVATIAGIPPKIVSDAKRISAEFEATTGERSAKNATFDLLYGIESMLRRENAGGNRRG
ncbi:MAG: DNA mismatch repair protein Msh6 [Amphiamblys sp. WSBS2006]|nr:MAG: DNA mismatch repair protein Msh6 [Amphiamblys sp. WSBS2006]